MILKLNHQTMKKTLLFSLFIMISVSVLGQEKKDSLHNNNKHSWVALGFSYEPKYCYRKTWSNISSIPYREDPGFYVKTETYSSNNEIGKYGYTAAFSLSYFVDKHIATSFGIGYSTMGYKTNKIDVLYVDIMDTGMQKKDKLYNKVSIDEIDEIYQLTTIPFSIEYFITIKKFAIDVGIGFCPTYIQTAKNVRSENNYTYTYDYLSNYYFVNRFGKIIFTTARLGCYYNFNSHIALGIFSNLNYQYNSLPSGYGNSLKLYSLGAEFKLLISLGKNLNQNSNSVNKRNSSTIKKNDAKQKEDYTSPLLRRD